MEYSILIRSDYYARHKEAPEKDLGSTEQPDGAKLALYQQKNFRTRMLNEKGQKIMVRPTKEPPAETIPTTTTPPIISTQRLGTQSILPQHDRYWIDLEDDSHKLEKLSKY